MSPTAGPPSTLTISAVLPPSSETGRMCVTLVVSCRRCPVNQQSACLRMYIVFDMSWIPCPFDDRASDLTMGIWLMYEVLPQRHSLKGYWQWMLHYCAMPRITRTAASKQRTSHTVKGCSSTKDDKARTLIPFQRRLRRQRRRLAVIGEAHIAQKGPIVHFKSRCPCMQHPICDGLVMIL